MAIAQGSSIAASDFNNLTTNQMNWKNYANHLIFDASAGISPSGAAVDNKDAYYSWSRTYPTLMGWNGNNTYGLRVDSCRLADVASSTPNADAVDGYHITAQTFAPSSLAHNTICIVYE
jgi:hypothetical protein